MPKCFFLTEDAHAYLVAHGTPPDDIQRSLIEETAKLGGVAKMQIAPEQGTFLTMLTRLIGAEHAVEVGTFTATRRSASPGVSRPAGTCSAATSREEWTAIAREYWAQGRRRRPHRAPHRARCRDARSASRRSEHRLRVHRRRQAELPQLLRGVAPAHAPERRHPRRQRAVGRLGDRPERERREHAAIKAFNDFVAADERVDVVMLPLADGLTLARKR